MMGSELGKIYESNAIGCQKSWLNSLLRSEFHMFSVVISSAFFMDCFNCWYCSKQLLWNAYESIWIVRSVNRVQYLLQIFFSIGGPFLIFFLRRFTHSSLWNMFLVVVCILSKIKLLIYQQMWTENKILTLATGDGTLLILLNIWVLLAALLLLLVDFRFILIKFNFQYDVFRRSFQFDCSDWWVIRF